jgi:hypothetical protein
VGGRVGGGVLVGKEVWVGITVGGDCVDDGVSRDNVGVSVGRLEGRLQASRARTRASVDNKLLDFIPSLLFCVADQKILFLWLSAPENILQPAHKPV